MAKMDQGPAADGIDSRVIKIRRTTKVVKGGRKLHFAVSAVAGDRNGKIGFGLGKATEVSVAIQKAMEDARKNMMTISLNGTTIRYMTMSRHGASKIFMQPASEGTGIIAGGAMRAVFEVLGVEDVIGKIIGSANAINVVRATLRGLSVMVPPEEIAAKRGKKLKEILE